jgi:hypothetical protein
MLKQGGPSPFLFNVFQKEKLEVTHMQACTHNLADTTCTMLYLNQMLLMHKQKSPQHHRKQPATSTNKAESAPDAPSVSNLLTAKTVQNPVFFEHKMSKHKT